MSLDNVSLTLSEPAEPTPGINYTFEKAKGQAPWTQQSRTSPVSPSPSALLSSFLCRPVKVANRKGVRYIIPLLRFYTRVPPADIALQTADGPQWTSKTRMPTRQPATPIDKRDNQPAKRNQKRKISNNPKTFRFRRQLDHDHEHKQKQSIIIINNTEETWICDISCLVITRARESAKRAKPKSRKRKIKRHGLSPFGPLETRG